MFCLYKTRLYVNTIGFFFIFDKIEKFKYLLTGFGILILYLFREDRNSAVAEAGKLYNK
jgi:hypothetical protein